MGRSYSRSRSRSLSSTSSGRAAKARDWNGEGGYRLHLSDLAIGISRHEIEKLFRPYGPLNEVWVATNPPCFAFINFCYREDGEQALKELDGKVVGGSRIGLRWARPRNYGGRPFHALLYRSLSRRHDYDRYSRRHYSRSRSRSPGYRRRSSSSRSPSPRGHRREKRSKPSRRDMKRRRSESESNSDNGRASRSKSNERRQAVSSNSGNHHTDIDSDGQD